jgi:hypothetical protein
VVQTIVAQFPTHVVFGVHVAHYPFQLLALGHQCVDLRVGGAVTGESGDRIVCDDPHNVQEAESDSIRKSTVVWFDTVMSTRMNDPKTSAKVVVMQRCHQQDLSGHLLEQGGWEHLCLPAEYEGTPCVTSIGWRDPRTQPGELLWPSFVIHQINGTASRSVRFLGK